ncbi:hypothetical protein [Kribbella sp. NBC_00359]|uniref:hypothetical protein n=1 Tax=Kribbella sp. NBC_00359 TaxID=2975966 RepID=UPI002E2030B1
MAEDAAAAALLGDSDWEKAGALIALVPALAAAGQRVRAIQVADDAEGEAVTITDPEMKAPALVELAWAMAVIGEPDRSRRLIARAWLEGRWEAPLIVLAVIEPDVLRQLATYDDAAILARQAGD